MSVVQASITVILDNKIVGRLYSHRQQRYFESESFHINHSVMVLFFPLGSDSFVCRIA